MNYRKKANRGYEQQMNDMAGAERHDTPYSQTANSGALNFDMLSDDEKRAHMQKLQHVFSAMQGHGGGNAPNPFGITSVAQQGGQVIPKFKSAARFDQASYKKNPGRRTKG
ncbi:MAG: hypothetical protein CMH79_05095 [Nitrospinae bacterium]|nr:hypothetical protein [Nitrospinota bacterium]|tara:strand:- start:330 stop:662 length:333 start_codon:yes stop_codon:yes gene_type:complete